MVMKYTEESITMYKNEDDKTAIILTYPFTYYFSIENSWHYFKNKKNSLNYEKFL